MMFCVDMGLQLVYRGQGSVAYFAGRRGALGMSGCGSAPRRRESSVEEESTRRVVD
jgi:hypothetical protein